MTYEVTIIQELLAQYRIPFYQRLREHLSAQGIQLRLLHGRAAGGRASRGDEAGLGWAEPVVNRHLQIAPSQVPAVWQPVLRAVTSSDLVVVEHANRQLVNYPLLVGQTTGLGPRLAFWGHGANLQAGRRDGAAERFKRRVARKAHWWFAYTEGSARRVTDAGFPRDRITVVNNSIDTSDYPVHTVKQGSTCVFVGSLHAHKRLRFLLEACEMVANQVPEFRLRVIGTGEERSIIESAARCHEWIEYRGALFGREKAAAVATSELTLMPGLVGLAVIDSFAGNAPIVTTGVPFHSPEFEYLQPGRNSIVLPAECSPAEYAQEVLDCLRDTHRLSTLRKGCERSAAVLTVDAMAAAFAIGVQNALAS